MMIKYKKCFAAVAASVLLALAGCGNTANEETAGGTDAASGAASETVSEAEENAGVTTADEAAADSDTETEAAAETENDADGSDDAEDEAASRSDMLVVYFSLTGEQYQVGVIDKGNTEIVAEMIAERTDADIFQIEPADVVYPTTYDELTDVAKQEQNEGARPAIAGEIPELSGYDTIFIGAPVWWGDWPMIMYTFFEENSDALAGRTLIPFSTHGGSGLAGFDTKLAAVCTESKIGTGLAIAGADAQNDPDGVRTRVDEWLAGLGY